MDLQKIFDNAITSARNDELRNSPQLLLGEIILKLEAVKDKSKPLYIDLRNKRPMGLNSWRGRYAELAIQTESMGYYNTDEVEKEYPEIGKTLYKTKDIGKKNPTAQEWIDVLKEAIGKTFTGYKGGDFLMSKNTPVWLAEYSKCKFKTDNKPLDTKDYANYNNVFFVDVRETAKKVYLVTKIENYGS